MAESGSGKSPAQKVLLRPLFRLQAEAEQDYQRALAVWQQRCQAAKDNGEAPPPQPTPREYFVTDATREAIIQIQANQPERGFLGWYDELSDIYRKLIALSQRSGWLKAKTVRNSLWALRDCSMDEIRQHFRELVALGQGCTRGNGNKLEWNCRE